MQQLLSSFSSSSQSVAEEMRLWKFVKSAALILLVFIGHQSFSLGGWKMVNSDFLLLQTWYCGKYDIMQPVNPIDERRTFEWKKGEVVRKKGKNGADKLRCVRCTHSKRHYREVDVRRFKSLVSTDSWGLYRLKDWNMEMFFEKRNMKRIYRWETHGLWHWEIRECQHHSLGKPQSDEEGHSGRGSGSRDLRRQTHQKHYIQNQGLTLWPSSHF